MDFAREHDRVARLGRDLPALALRPTSADDEAELVADGYTPIPGLPPGGPRGYRRANDDGTVTFCTIFEDAGPWTLPGC